jgi:FkbM family methyltransferase
MEIYYTPAGSDQIIKNFFVSKNIINGTYLDVGSMDGKRFSNTYLLEKHGWTGICVEAHPSYFKFLKENRPNSKCYSCAAGDVDNTDVEINLNYRASLTSLDFSKEQHFREHYNQWYADRSQREINGFLNGKHTVKMRTLDSILNENNYTKLNLISIDIDGSEKYAFNGLTIDKYSPELISLEWSVNGVDFTNEYAAKFGYTKGIMQEADIFYVKNDEDYNILKNIKVSGVYMESKHPCD